MSVHPKWATKHKYKGTELRLINGRYYLYEVSSKWDPEKKRAKKISGRILGRITKEDGFIESEKTKLRRNQLKIQSLSTKEYGLTAFIQSHLSEYEILLKKHFPDYWEIIMTLTYGRFAHKSAMKNMKFHYLHSYLSEIYPNISIDSKQLSYILREIGAKRNNITDFFNEFSKANDNIIFDGTDLLSSSKKMSIAKLSKNKKGTYDSLLNIMFVFSVGLQLPIYYRISAGNIKDIKAFKLSLKESNIKDAVIIADKGFYSITNIKELNAGNLKFIIPLRRNNKFICYDKTEVSNKKEFDGYFKYNKRIIWYYSAEIEAGKITIFLDEELKAEETKDYLSRIDILPDKYDLETFYKKQKSFGTITLMHNTDKTPNELYVDYKSRGQVEGMIDVLKNIVESDKSYMQNEQALEAWMFINYIALHWYYKIIALLKKNKLNNKFSPMDLVEFLKEIRKVKINNNWYNSEITKKTADLLDTLNIHIT